MAASRCLWQVLCSCANWCLPGEAGWHQLMPFTDVQLRRFQHAHGILGKLLGQVGPTHR